TADPKGRPVNPGRSRTLRRYVSVTATAAAVVALGVVGLTSATAATTGTIVGFGGKCVDVAATNSANGTQVQLFACNGGGAQQWTVGDDRTIRALGKCLDVAGASGTNGTKVQIWDCNGTGAQRWTAGTDGTLRALGKCLDATNVSSADGTPWQVWDCTGGANQRWTVPSGPGGPPPPPTGTPDLGPNVVLFDPGMAAGTIQGRLNSIFSQQERNQFGGSRYAVLFKPGTYNVDANVGFYTQVAGLGLAP